MLLGFLVFSGLLALAMRPERIRVEVAAVQRDLVEVYVQDDGITRVRERYTLIAPVSGKLVRMQVHAGDSVDADSGAIITLEPTDSELIDPRTKLEAEARVKAAQVSILRADELRTIAVETLELAEHEYLRASELIKSDAMSQSEFDSIEHRFRIGKAEVRAAEFLRSVAEHEMALAQAVLKASQSGGGESMLIGSPIDGIVLKVLREDAGFVSAGTPLLEIGDPHDMEIQVDVLSTAAVSIREGARVVVSSWGGSNGLRGRVRRIEPSAFLKISALGVEERRVNVLIDLDDPWENRETLGDGFRVDAKILVESSKPDVICVPTAAVEVSTRGSFVYVLEKNPWGGDRVKRMSVQTGLSSREKTEILSGLQIGDLVVLYPPETLKDGSWVMHEHISGVDRNGPAR